MDRTDSDALGNRNSRNNNLRQNGPYVLCSKPFTQGMANFGSRIKTFITNWPNHVQATPREIANAGLFFLGQGDRVKCFYCNGGLQNWQHDDDPWLEHAKWYPHCEYLLKMKGESYISQVIAQFPNIENPFRKMPSVRCAGNDVPPSGISLAVSAPLVVADEVPSYPRANSPDNMLAKAMESEIVTTAGMFGFDEPSVMAVVKRKLENSGLEYSSVKDLVADIQKYESGQTQENENINVVSTKSSNLPRRAAGKVLMAGFANAV